ncbi:hypothetical protein DYI37_12635 [Fulvimarina endophytica]|uniref:YhaN AAA domain-containing protein n=1 Tax=Fulvimarina endophytica TaxID=2293836 RepID=A0A371X0S0_9HYPH|nr:YhaN family protein [Fulvimarina endophytica]RFC62809.1 hypothetical protein DYI37_12635 [Fulvimarina endophytica]
MRIERLDLIRYGAFTNRTIPFRPGARLHILYGPNEAGKSTTLQSLSDLLFGFEHAVTAAFRHDAPTLRIGASLISSDGTTLSFRRRRGRAKTLLQDDDTETALRDDTLAPFVGGLTKYVFESAFGLDSHRLRAGADAMLANDGELGGSLLAAASGLTGLSDLKREFEEEAGQLYAPRASTKAFNTLKSQWDEARQKVRDRELKATDWRALNAEIDALAERHDEIRQKRADTLKRYAELTLLQQLVPVMHDLDADLRKLADTSDLAHLPENFGARLATALERRDSASEASAKADIRVAEAERALSDIALDEKILDHAKKIGSLHARTGDYVKTRKDLPRIEAELREREGEIEERLARLGIDGRLAKERQPSDAEIALAEALSKEGEELAREAGVIARQRESEVRDRAELERKAPAGHLADPKPSRERFASLKPELEALAAIDGMEAEHRREKRRIEDEASRLDPPLSDIGAIAAADLPSAEWLTTHRDRLAAIDRDVQTRSGRLDETHREIETNRKSMRALEQAGDIPSREAIETARARRDEAFEPIASALTSSSRPPEPTEMRRTLRAFETLSIEADSLADAALKDAERVERHGSLSRRTAELQDMADHLRKDLERLGEDRATLWSAYAGAFRPLGIAPYPPSKMIEWVGEVRRLVSDRRENEERSATLDRLRSREAVLRPLLIALGRSLHLEDAEALPSEVLGRAIERRIEDISDLWTSSRGHAELVRSSEARLALLDGRAAENGTARRLWREKADGGFGKLGLAAGASPAEANATIALWRELPQLEGERRNREGRVNGMRRDAAQFEREVGEFLAENAPSLSELPTEQAVESLYAMSEAAFGAKAKRDERARALADAKQEADSRSGELSRAGAECDALLSQCPEGSDPETLVRRLGERDLLAGHLRQTRQRLADLAPNRTEDNLREALDGFDPQAATLEVEDLGTEEQDLESEAREVFADLRDRQKQKETLARGGGAETAAFEQRAIEAELLDLARQWAVLKIAANLVGGAIDTHRRRQDAPLMRRAGERLARLTGGAFGGLSQQFTDGDRAELLAVRENGERLRICDLSDGTRDQLFLALRLAFIEDYATRNEAIPFVGDDLFQTFDDERTGAGLETLADASEHMQPILFAHHRSVIEIARQRLGNDVDVIELENC